MISIHARGESRSEMEISIHSIFFHCDGFPEGGDGARQVQQGDHGGVAWQTGGRGRGDVHHGLVPASSLTYTEHQNLQS